MKVILLKDVVKLGKKYDIKDVSSGFALNLLIPQGLAVIATEEKIKMYEEKKKQIDDERKVHKDLIEKNLNSLNEVTLNIFSKVNEKGHLFAGIHKEEIVKELQKQTEIQIDPSFIQLDHPIKEVGEYVIEVKDADKTAKFKIIISPLK